MCQFLLVPSKELISFGPHCCFRKENDVLLHKRLNEGVKGARRFWNHFLDCYQCFDESFFCGAVHVAACIPVASVLLPFGKSDDINNLPDLSI